MKNLETAMTVACAELENAVRYAKTRSELDAVLRLANRLMGPEMRSIIWLRRDELAVAEFTAPLSMPVTRGTQAELHEDEDHRAPAAIEALPWCGEAAA